MSAGGGAEVQSPVAAASASPVASPVAVGPSPQDPSFYLPPTLGSVRRLAAESQKLSAEFEGMVSSLKSAHGDLATLTLEYTRSLESTVRSASASASILVATHATLVRKMLIAAQQSRDLESLERHIASTSHSLAALERGVERLLADDALEDTRRQLQRGLATEEQQRGVDRDRDQDPAFQTPQRRHDSPPDTPDDTHETGTKMTQINHTTATSTDASRASSGPPTTASASSMAAAAALPVAPITPATSSTAASSDQASNDELGPTSATSTLDAAQATLALGTSPRVNTAIDPP